MSVKQSLVSIKAKLAGAVHDVAMLPAKAHVLVLTVAVSASTSAYAQGFSGIFRGASSGFNEFIRLAILGAMVAGICATIYGLFQFAKKGMNRGEDIEWTKVLYPLIGGGLLTVVMYILTAVVEELGGSRSDMGRTF